MKIAAAFDDPTPLQAGGIILGGTKYMFIRADDRMIAGKKVRPARSSARYNPRADSWL